MWRVRERESKRRERGKGIGRLREGRRVNIESKIDLLFDREIAL